MKQNWKKHASGANEISILIDSGTLMDAYYGYSIITSKSLEDLKYIIKLIYDICKLVTEIMAINILNFDSRTWNIVILQATQKKANTMKKN